MRRGSGMSRQRALWVNRRMRHHNYLRYPPEPSCQSISHRRCGLHDNASVNDALPKLTYVLERNAETVGNVLQGEGEIWFPLFRRTSRKIFHDPEEVAPDLALKLRKHYLLGLCKLGTPFVGNPNPEFFKFFKML